MPATEQRWLVIAVAMVIVAAGGISLLWYEAPGDDETPPTAPTLTLLSRPTAAASPQPVRSWRGTSATGTG